MILAIWQPDKPTSTRGLDLYAVERNLAERVERRATQAAIAGVIAYRAVVLGVAWIADHKPRRRA